MDPSVCHVCGKRTEAGSAYARLRLRGERFLVCCPMCFTALEAGSVQRRLMPSSHSGRHADVTVRYLPALHVGGDFAVVDQRGSRLSLAVGDVSGHGVTAALLSSRLVPEVERRLGGSEDLAAIAVELNDVLLGLLGSSRSYATLLLARVEPAAGRMAYLSCGHPAPLLWRERAAHPEVLPGHHFPVGLFEAGQFGRPSSGQVRIAAGDRLLAYSDGLTEVLEGIHADAAGGLERHFRAAAGLSGASETEAGAYERLAARHGTEAADDVLYLVVQLRNGSRPPAGESGRPAPPGARDPVCGMAVSVDSPHRVTSEGVTVVFCSAACLRAFDRTGEEE